MDNDAIGFGDDGSPICGTRSISVINNTPNAVSDSYASIATLDVSESGSFTNYNVCSNDTDIEGDTISYASNTSLSGLTGTLTRVQCFMRAAGVV